VGGWRGVAMVGTGCIIPKTTAN